METYCEPVYDLEVVVNLMSQHVHPGKKALVLTGRCARLTRPVLVVVVMEKPLLLTYQIKSNSS
jgi:hypothetical protein